MVEVGQLLRLDPEFFAKRTDVVWFKDLMGSLLFFFLLFLGKFSLNNF